ncbi:glycosyltransferase family 4 protein [Candidatus Nucleicultrix amoebiphila]|uniref:glycosyltransferase family 4 protein n=1 Tax=Candidatus Nucleicultrix amoebiphila TaxID=1509244 RepID=UPI000A26F780|nr:glycosyltransferase family 4 protein [Candidatus Nucleicultrix amoebiphila]
MTRKKILYLVAEDHYFLSHRFELAKASVNQGFEVVLATNVSKYLQQIQSAGIRVVPLKHFHRSSLNPFKDLKTLKELYKIYKNERPDIVHQVALKPVLYCTLIARILKIPHIINAIAGMGHVFTDQGLKTRGLRIILSQLFRFILKSPHQHIIVQNPDDRHLILNLCSIEPTRVVLIRGSGVDTKLFKKSPEKPIDSKGPKVALVARMLWSKGIREAIEAQKILKAKNKKLQLFFYGNSDPKNPAAVPNALLKTWQKEGLIHWEGHCDHVQDIYKDTHISLLPSYREGLPRSLLEAAAAGKPIITTDTPGCREIVQDGVNGFLVPIKNPQALANALERLIDDKQLRQKMGQKGRELIQKEFSDEIIISQTIRLYKDKSVKVSATTGFLKI